MSSRISIDKVLCLVVTQLTFACVTCHSSLKQGIHVVKKVQARSHCWQADEKFLFKATLTANPILMPLAHYFPHDRKYRKQSVQHHACIIYTSISAVLKISLQYELCKVAQGNSDNSLRSKQGSAAQAGNLVCSAQLLRIPSSCTNATVSHCDFTIQEEYLKFFRDRSSMVALGKSIDTHVSAAHALQKLWGPVHCLSLSGELTWRV